MSIKLVYGPTKEYPAAQVHTVDEKFGAVAGFLQSDLDKPYHAREFAKKVRAVIAKERDALEGAGNGYYFNVRNEISELGLDVGEPPKTISISTADLLEAVEEWADHLEKSRTWPDWALKGPIAK